MATDSIQQIESEQRDVDQGNSRAKHFTVEQSLIKNLQMEFRKRL